MIALKPREPRPNTSESLLMRAESGGSKPGGGAISTWSKMNSGLTPGEPGGCGQYAVCAPDVSSETLLRGDSLRSHTRDIDGLDMPRHSFRSLSDPGLP